MRKRDFEELVRKAVGRIPPEFLAIMENVDVQVRRRPTARQLRSTDLDADETLLGLYEGVPITDRGDYNMVLPDKITLFQIAIEAVCSSDEEIVREIRDTVVHEVAHHFGIEDDRLEELGI